jgi:hypothetical protein
MNNKEKITMSKEQRNNKLGFLTLLFTICYLLFVIACDNTMEMPETLTPIKDGYGTFSLSIDGTTPQSRTILPSLNDDLFVGFSLEFTNTVTLEVHSFYRTKDNFTFASAGNPGGSGYAGIVATVNVED